MALLPTNIQDISVTFGLSDTTLLTFVSLNISLYDVTSTPLITCGIFTQSELPIYLNSPLTVPLKSSSVANTQLGSSSTIPPPSLGSISLTVSTKPPSNEPSSSTTITIAPKNNPNIITPINIYRLNPSPSPMP